MTTIKSAVFPAPAGINRSSSYEGWWGWRVPRASGDKPGVIIKQGV
ncbi:TPA: hypothetical protein J8046_000630 [Escherichia coli]|nr:hypothetical protein [Escherichia coli]HAN3907939.1 hypothetical protein [Escherichia coli]HBA4383639.1 hypothetical protein [Escherichia coli]HBB1779103.1 hypothetical protein [Escherichia coli]